MDLTRKSWYVSVDHLTNPPSSMTYASVVVRDRTGIEFLVVALNELEILMRDTQNAYLNALTKQKDFFYAGYEWKSDQGSSIFIVRNFYGRNICSLVWSNHLNNIIGNFMGSKSTLAVPDVWLKPTTASEHFKYYTYILVYVYNILIFDTDLRKYIAMLGGK